MTTKQETAQKSLPVALLLWLFGGWAGAHRFYMGRTAGAMALLVLFVSAAACLLTFLPSYLEFEGEFAEEAWLITAFLKATDREYLWAGTVLLGLWVFFWAFDAAFLPHWINEWNGEAADQPGTIGTVSNIGDPSFQATMRAAGAAERKGPKKPVIPEGYEMPWRKEETVRRYNPDDDTR